MKKHTDKSATPARAQRCNMAANWRTVILMICFTTIAGTSIAIGYAQAAASQKQNLSGETLWQDVAESSITAKGRRETIPSRYRTVRLDMTALKTLLAKAPMELTDAAKSSSLEITMPMPDGTSARFKVEESPMMEPALAAKFPEIKTYQGQGLDDRTATMRFDLTMRGFHAIILSVKGDVYIDPYAEGDTEHYISYYKRDFRTAVEDPFHCFTEDSDLARSLPPGLAPHGVGFGTRYIFRLALAATGEYVNFFRMPGDDDNQARQRALSAQVTTINRVNAIYRRDISVHMVLIANNFDIIYADPNQDPYTFPMGTAQVNQQNQQNLDNVIGFDNYDIGHVVGIGGGGRGSIAGVCGDIKAEGSTGTNAPVGDPFDIDYVAHEMGHQFGANHTFNDGTNGNCGGGARTAAHAMEPGSGSTIMGYAGICPSGGGGANLQMNSDSYFHTRSIEQIFVWLLMPDGFTCAALQATGNTMPDFSPPASHTVPARTPFELYAGDLTDPDGDVITYCWEELDVGAPSPPEGDGDGQQRPLFRSYLPSLNSRRVFPSMFYVLNNANNPPATYGCTDAAGNPFNCITGESLATITQTMTFRVTARDNHDGIAAEQLQVSVVGTAGPFNVVQPNTNVTWTKGSRRTVTWSVANTNIAPINCANVKITLSIDNGLTFPYVLLGSTPNDGSEDVILPDVETIQARIKIEAVDNVFFDVSDGAFTIKPIEVTTEADNGNNNAPVQESLREAIIAANNLPGIQTIPFNIPGGGVKTINLMTELPAIEDPIVIDGWSQGPAGYSGPPLIELNGAGAGINAAGLIVNSGNSLIRGLAINRFSNAGIVLQFSGGNRVQGCYIGTNAAGTAAAGNVGNGVSINNTSGNIIGRQTSAAEGNVISGNAVGILLIGSNATGNNIRGNYIGTDAAGSTRVSNTQDGIHITDAPGNIIGGTHPLYGNIISGNGTSGGAADGIEITGATSSGNMILGNFIGLAANGNGALGNLGSGVRIDNAPGTIIGGTDAAARNIIVDNRNQGGIALIGPSSSGTTIHGNYIGIDSTGNVARPNNAYGIYVESGNTTIGGAATGAGNVISGGGTGIFLFGYPGSTGNTIQGNYIGTNAAGTAALNTTGTGIELRSGSTGALIGGTTAAARNIISGNFDAIHDFVSNTVIQGNYIGTNAAGTAAVPNQRGVLIDGGTNHTIGGTVGTAGNVISGNGTGGNDHGISLANTSNCTVQGNRIGTNAAGTARMGNGGHGVQVFNSTNVGIGGASASARNIISANGGNGISLGSGSNSIVVQGNYIGTDINGTADFGNGQTTGSAGIEIQSGSHTIGGSDPGEGNLIAFSGCFCFGNNFGSGIRVFSSGNRIRGNSIFGNAELGIDLAGGAENAFRVTANDNCDADSGPNNLQNFPALTSATSSGVNLTVAGTLNSTANSTFTLDFYAGPACDASGQGEGQVYLGSAPVMTDGSCNASFNATLPGMIPQGWTITATATDPSGSTSEFSPCVSAGCGYALSPLSQFFRADGGSGSVNLSTGGNACAWSVTASDNWLTLTSNPNGSGNDTITFEVRENFSGSARQATVNAGGQSMVVVQDGGLGEACGYEIAPTFGSFAAGGGSGTITVTADARCAWQAVASASWVTVTSIAVGIGNGSVSYTVAANLNGAGRKATITIGGRVFAIKQK